MAMPQSQPEETTFYVTDYNTLDLTPYDAVLRQVLDSGETIESLTIRAYNDTANLDSTSRVQTLRFASLIRDWFIANGVDPNAITTIGYGEDDLAVETADGVAEQLNRRIVIEVVAN